MPFVRTGLRNGNEALTMGSVASSDVVARERPAALGLSLSGYPAWPTLSRRWTLFLEWLERHPPTSADMMPPHNRFADDTD